GFIKVYSSGMSSGEKYALASDVLRLWDSYSAMVACWILCDYAPHARSISKRKWFASPRFLMRSLAASARIKSAVAAALA
ncbi:MAG: hypothetical protein V1787_04405, partial [Candidatus Micrarchaeota archaeon]